MLIRLRRTRPGWLQEKTILIVDDTPLVFAPPENKGGISRIWVDVNFGISKCVWLCNLVKVCSPYVEEDDSESLPVSMETETQYMVVFSEENLDCYDFRRFWFFASGAFRRKMFLK